MPPPPLRTTAASTVAFKARSHLRDMGAIYPGAPGRWRAMAPRPDLTASLHDLEGVIAASSSCRTRGRLRERNDGQPSETGRPARCAELRAQHSTTAPMRRAHRSRTGRTTMYVIGGFPNVGAGDRREPTMPMKARIPQLHGRGRRARRQDYEGRLQPRDEKRQVWRRETLKSHRPSHPATNTWAASGTCQSRREQGERQEVLRRHAPVRQEGGRRLDRRQTGGPGSPSARLGTGGMSARG